MRLFRVDDGCIYSIMAADHAAAKQLWHQHMLDSGHTEKDIAEDFDDPEVVVIQPSDAAGIMVTEEDLTRCVRCASCPECGGLGRVPKQTPLLDLFRAEVLLPEEKRARNGILSCSEW